MHTTLFLYINYYYVKTRKKNLFSVKENKLSIIIFFTFLKYTDLIFHSTSCTEVNLATIWYKGSEKLVDSSIQVSTSMASQLCVGPQGGRVGWEEGERDRRGRVRRAGRLARVHVDAARFTPHEHVHNEREEHQPR